mgnify:FL=1
MIQKLLDMGFGFALHLKNGGDLHVRVRFKNREQRTCFKKGTDVDAAIVESATNLADAFPHLVDPKDVSNV